MPGSLRLYVTSGSEALPSYCLQQTKR